MWCAKCREGWLAGRAGPKAGRTQGLGSGEVREVFKQDGDLSKAWWILGVINVVIPSLHYGTPACAQHCARRWTVRKSAERMGLVTQLGRHTLTLEIEGKKSESRRRGSAIHSNVSSIQHVNSLVTTVP